MNSAFGKFPTACLTLRIRSSAMAFSCSFQRITGTDCSFDRLDKSRSLEIVTLSNCSKDISNHCSHWTFSGVTTESDLILARVGIFREEETQRLDTICPHHRRELGLGWRRNSSKCCVPQILSQHGAYRKADRGISKRVSEHIFKTTEMFFPVGSGELCFRLEITVFRTEYRFRTAGGNSRSKSLHAN